MFQPTLMSAQPSIPSV